MTKHLLLLTCAVGAISGVTGVSVASAADTGQSATEVGAVIVTAEKREQNLQKVPVAVTAITKTQRDIIGINTLQDMTNFTPGMTYTSTTDHLYVRGVGRQSINLAADAGVSAYTDGFYNPDPVLIVLPSMFIGSTEVLRGPQGTLSGRNGIAGSIQVNSTRPTSTPYAEARATVGNYGVINTELAVSGPLADGLNMRVAGFNNTQQQGYFKNLAGGPSEGGKINVWYLESSITAKLGDNADLFVKAFTFGNKSRGGPGARAGWDQNPFDTTLVSDTANLSYNPAYAYGGSALNVNQINPAITQNVAQQNKYNFSGSFPLQVLNRDTGDLNAVFTYHFPGVDMKYTGGYQQYTYQTIQSSGTFGYQTDVTSYTVPLTSGAGFGGVPDPTCTGPEAAFCLTVFPTVTTNYTQTDHWYSHELNFASTQSGPVQWIAGIYYYDEQYSNPVFASMNGQSQVVHPIYDSTHVAPANPGHNLYTSNYTMEERSKAVYGQVDWSITDTLKLTGGLRFTQDDKFGTEYYRIVTFGGSAEYTGVYGATYAPTYAGSVATQQGIVLPLSSNPAYPAAVAAAIASATGPQLALANAIATGTAAATAGAITGGGYYGVFQPALDFTSALCGATLPTYPGLNANQKGVKSNCAVNPTTGVASRNLGDTSSATTGTAGIEWTPDSSTLAYARYSRGYKELGFNAGALATSAEVAPEHMNDYELGVKKSFGHNLVVDAALFYEDYQDGQFPVTVLNSIGQNTTQFLSIPKARSDGFELETIWTPVEHLQLLLAYSYNDTAFTTGSCNLTTHVGCYVDVMDPYIHATTTPKVQSINGNALPNSPKNKVSVNGNYTLVFDPGSLTLSASYLWRDKQYGSIFTAPQWAAPAWSQVDLRATWKGRNDRYEIVAYGANVFNTSGYPSGATAYDTGSPATPTVYTINKAYTTNPPATYGMEFHYKFF